MSEQTDSSPDKASQEENGWNFISLADFLAVGLENPILGCRTINCSNLSLEYQSATKVARDIGDEQAGCVFALLADLCDMHFKPQDRAKPYGPLFSCGDNRSLIPSDLPSEQSMVLAELALHIINSGLRARLADVAWYNERRLVHCARTAIDAYVEGVRRVMDGSAVLDEDDDPNDPRLVDMLRRACSIARSTGWDRVENDALRVTVCDLREKAAGGLPFPFSKIAGLDLEHGITPAEELARQIEQVAARLPSDGVPWTGKELWGLAAKAFHKARDEENWRRCRLEMANSFVRWAERPSLSAMLAASWYEEAIGALHGVPNVKERRQELQQRMVERQRDIRYEMGTVSHSVDISDLVSSVRKELSGLSLPEGLKRFALLAKSPDPQELEQNALDLAMKHPLQSLFAVQMLDREGKVRSKSSAADFRNGPDANGLRHQIVRHEELRHQMIAVAMIEPARWLLHTEQRLDTHDLIPLVTLSPFVPHGHEMIFATGFAHFFAGDFLVAAHLLVPQVEGALRHMLRQVGHDVTNMRTDGTQESRSLSNLLDPKGLRRELEAMFGPAIVREVDDLFDFHGGPALRHGLAHGLMSDGAFWNEDVIYACWFVFRLVVLALLPCWQKVEQFFPR